uniref:Reverse transcriptase domain-containing protein n=1 Tax=Phytophthora ramorum TaxID=164328 RepID=H3H9U1_PHYRM
MRLNNPPTLASELMSLPVTSWKRFARELHDGRIEQICILSDVERMTCEAEELNQLISEGADALSAKSKKERFDEQVWDSLKASPFYKGGWRIVHAYNKLNDTTVPAQTPIPRKDVIIDSMTSSTIFSTLDLRDGFYQILMRESDIPLTAVSTPSGMLWEWLGMPQGLKNAPATFNSRAVNWRSDVEMHTEHLRKLLELMRKHKLYANLKKCIFGATEIPVLGCLVGKNGELRQFLGLATYSCNRGDDNTVSTTGVGTINNNEQHAQAGPAANKEHELNQGFRSDAMDFVQRRQAVIVQDAIAASVDRQKLNADNTGETQMNSKLVH